MGRGMEGKQAERSQDGETEGQTRGAIAQEPRLNRAPERAAPAPQATPGEA
jgi:hypothetical protein